MTTKPIRRRAKRALKLPTFRAFKRMTIFQRNEVFLAWVKTQRGHYLFLDNAECPLARFGRALTGKTVWAGAYGFVRVGKKGPTANECLQDAYRMDKGRYTSVVVKQFALCSSPKTYRALARRLS